VLAKVFQSIPLYFAHWQDSTIRKDQLDEAFRGLTEKALASGTRAGFSLLMIEFLARLNNIHTGFRDPCLLDLPPLGMVLRPIEGQWTVVESELPDLRVGHVVQDIEGRTVAAWVDELRRYTAGSPQARTVQFADLIRYFIPERYALCFKDERGADHSLTVDRTLLERSTAPASTEGRWLRPDLAYIQVPSFGAPELEERALAYVKDFQKAACLIVDVRGNPGGNTPGELTRALMDRPYRWWTESSPLNVGLLAYEAQHGHNAHLFGDSNLLWRSPARDPDAEAYRGRLLILTDRGTLSAAEDFTMPFKDNGRATLIGERTAGSTGQPFYYAFDNQMMFAIGTKRAYMPDGTRFEGVGIAPDIQVVARREALYAQIDPVLEKAIAVATTG
jgi:carboxyl-terminal processing protease